MSEFKSWKSFGLFSDSVTRRTRFVRDAEQEDFLKSVLDTALKRVQPVSTGSSFWRAQLGCNWEVFGEPFAIYLQTPGPLHPDRMKPRTNGGREGRANPKGIPCLYLSTDQETAIAEARPWVDSWVSVGQLVVKKPLSIVNCSGQDTDDILYREEPGTDERESAVWSAIDRAFARPITTTDENAEYVPTQILAEVFKCNGYDGIEYRSSLGTGRNIVLFDLSGADIVSCVLYKIHSVSFNYSEAGSPYSVEVKAPLDEGAG